MNVRGALPSGHSQDPLNYLQRQIAKSTRFDNTTKRHVMIHIRKAKAARPPYDQALTESLRLWSYAQMLRLQALLETLDVTDKAYKATLWARCKVSEDYRSYLSRHLVAGNGKRQHHDKRTPPLSPSSRPQPIGPESDVETA